MSIFGGTKVKSSRHFENALTEGETIEAVYRLVVDEICFTNKRIIFFDKTILSTKKGKVSIPYKNIRSFVIEDEGIFDRDIEVKLLTGGADFTLKFSKGADIIEVEKILAYYTCN